MGPNSSDSLESNIITSPGTDVASTVFSFAPYWVTSSYWAIGKVQHPGLQTNSEASEASFIHFSEPQTSEEMLQLYRNRQMKGSNLVVGLSSRGLAKGTVIPSTFFRTLAYVFEVAKQGSSYAPLVKDDITRGHALKGWCEPLWLQGSEGGSASSSLDPQSTVTSPASTLALAPGADTATDPASILFSSAPFWCYLYNHEPSRAKKTPPKAAEQMLDMHRTGCLPDWTPVLGLQLDVSTFNSLPPSLFMPLGTLLRLASLGVPCKAVGMKELSRWDKFMGSRTSNGCTKGVIQHAPNGRPSMSDHSQGQPLSVPSSPSALQPGAHSWGSGAAPQNGGRSQHCLPSFYPATHGRQHGGFFNSGSNGYVHGSNDNGMYPPALGGSVRANAGPPQHMMWGYQQYNAVPGTGEALSTFVPPSTMPSTNHTGYTRSGLPSSHAYSQDPNNHALKGPLQLDRGAWPTGQHRNGGGADSRKSRGGSKKGGPVYQPLNQHLSLPVPPLMIPSNHGGMVMSHSMGVSPNDPSSCAAPSLAGYGHARVWETALFRLFTATRDGHQAAWWHMLEGDPASIAGPFGGEQMIIEHCRGHLHDRHIICGTTSDVPAHLCPADVFFENFGSVLNQVDTGGQYVLVTHAEILQHESSIVAPGQQPNPPAATSRPTTTGGPFWCGSSSGTNSQRASGSGDGRDNSHLPPFIEDTAHAAAVMQSMSTAPQRHMAGGQQGGKRGQKQGAAAGMQAHGTGFILDIRSEVDDKVCR